jgi:hypothetical protein
MDFFIMDQLLIRYSVPVRYWRINGTHYDSTSGTGCPMSYLSERTVAEWAAGQAATCPICAGITDGEGSLCMVVSYCSENNL